MKISTILKPSLIKLSLKSEDKEELFEEMVDLFVRDGCIKDRATAIQVLEERETRMSTGISNGLGLPHNKLPEAKDILIGLGISQKGIDYDSLDGEPVYIVITIFASEDKPGQHIQVLAEIARLFSISGFLDKLRLAKSVEEIINLIKAEE